MLKSKREPAEIFSVGLDVAAPKIIPVGPPEAPLNLHAMPTANEGEV